MDRSTSGRSKDDGSLGALASAQGRVAFNTPLTLILAAALVPSIPRSACASDESTQNESVSENADSNVPKGARMVSTDQLTNDNPQDENGGQTKDEYVGSPAEGVVNDYGAQSTSDSEIVDQSMSTNDSEEIRQDYGDMNEQMSLSSCRADYKQYDSFSNDNADASNDESYELIAHAKLSISTRSMAKVMLMVWEPINTLFVLIMSHSNCMMLRPL